MAYFFKRQFAEAASKLLLSIQDNPGSPTHTALSRPAMLIWDDLKKRVGPLPKCAPLPLWSRPTNLPYRNAEHRELLLSGLRLAADEEK